MSLSERLQRARNGGLLPTHPDAEQHPATGTVPTHTPVVEWSAPAGQPWVAASPARPQPVAEPAPADASLAVASPPATVPAAGHPAPHAAAPGSPAPAHVGAPAPGAVSIVPPPVALATLAPPAPGAAQIAQPAHPATSAHPVTGVSSGVPPQPAPTGPGAEQSPRTASHPTVGIAKPADPFRELKNRVAEELYRRVGSRLHDTTLTEEKLHQLTRDELTRIVADEPVALTPAERNRVIEEIGADVLGYGPLEPLLADSDVSEIMVNRFDQIFVERGGRLTESPTQFTGEQQLRRVIERIVSRVGRRIDEASPLVDARLEDGSRVNAVIPPLAVDGSSLTIRKFSKSPLKVADLIRFDTINEPMAVLLEACVQAKLNILVSGGTGTGKTTLLNVLSSFIPDGERIVTIEDAVELQLQQNHVVRLESRPSNIEGRGEITIRDLVRNSLRMRPDRIVIGECRGGEALDMLQAMNTGHEGSISTIHANTPRDAISRLETLVLMAGMDLPLRAIREQVASAIDVIVQISRLRDGSRRVVSVTEVQGMEGDVVTLQDAFSFDYSAGVAPDGRFLGHTRSTGVRPRFVERFEEYGIHVPISVFETPGNTLGRGH
ncbi:MAG TPA: ATPase, T2SS/T4P/T4SS family [Candidatus Lumbricidophila sp.]|nr:ATPase, T2SS/T4P/T4SS family [Candidatus Lumbricidophila sp.]